MIDASGAPAPTPCGRSVRKDAAAQVWEAVCRNAPPLPDREGVDALSDIAEDIYEYAINERCDVVSKAECFAEWMSLPGGAVGGFNAMKHLKGDRKATYQDIRRILVDEEVAAGGAARVGELRCN